MTEKRGFRGESFGARSTGVRAYEPGKPVEEVQRELGLERVVKLASNEGPFPPFPAALEAIEQADFPHPEPLSRRRGPTCCGRRWPSGTACAFEEVVCRRGRGRADRLRLAGDARSRRRDGLRLAVVRQLRDRRAYNFAAVPNTVPLVDHRYDVDAILEAIGPKTKLVFICDPNNPTGTMSTRAELDSYFDAGPRSRADRARPGVLRVPRRSRDPDGIEEYVKAGQAVLVLRTFSKMYGLAGLRVGYGVGAF